MKQMLPKTNKRGITLVELTMVLGVLVILAAIPLVNSFGATENLYAQACRASCDSIFTYWQVNLRLTGSNEYPPEDAIAYCLSADAKMDAVQPCPSGGKYSVQYTGGEQTKKAEKVVCSLHDKKKSTIEQELQETMEGYVDAIKRGEKPGGIPYLNNDLIRQSMYESFGGKWPTITFTMPDGTTQTLYIQPYFEGAVKEPPGSPSEVTAIFANGNQSVGTEDRNNWNTSYLYNFETRTWYRHANGAGGLISDTSFMYKSKEYINSMLNNQMNGWEPVPDSEITYGDWEH